MTGRNADERWDPQRWEIPNDMSSKLPQQIAAAIRMKIDSGVLRPGDRLLGEIDLMKLFKASRESVRSALLILKTEHRIRGSNRGARCVVLGAEERYCDLNGIKTGKYSELDVIKTKLAVETAAAVTVAANASAIRIEEIRKTQDNISKSGYANLAQGELEFHRAIVEHCEVEPLIDFYHAMWDNFVEIENRRYPHGYATDLAQEHGLIISLLWRGDIPAVSSTFESHVLMLHPDAQRKRPRG